MMRMAWLVLACTALVAPPCYGAQQYRLGKLSITGNRRTDDLTVRRMIPLNEGDIFNLVRWEQGLEQISRSGLFEPVTSADVTLTFDEANGVVNAELRLKERDHQRIDVSAGGGTTGGFAAGIDYANINLTGGGDRLSARLRAGSRERSAGAQYSTALLLKNPVRIDLAGFYNRLEFVDARAAPEEREPLFVERTAGASFGISFPFTAARSALGAATQASLAYSFTSTNLLDAPVRSSVNIGEIDQERIRVASITPSIIHDTLDRDFDPREGSRLVVATELGARLLGGSLNAAMPSIDFRWFHRLDRERREPRVVGLRLRATHIAAFGERLSAQALAAVDGVPIFRRFFLGGETEVRGYDVNSIAPLARVDRFLAPPGETPILLSSEVRPVGGDSRIIVNAEYRAPLIWQFSGAVFFDLGASLNARGLKEERFESTTMVEPFPEPLPLITVLRPLDAGEDRFPNYRVSLGGELRFQIPFFNLPARLILSFNPNAQRNLPESLLLAPERRVAFRFGVGRTL
ncbi:MAG TPA: BamA/TamA family outer membrane protein [Blastocatellia bacterium]|nr:BamA/TamA family outer membrane protein [Blastocatellia bacterium]